MSDVMRYDDAVQAIKQAILAAQYRAAKAGNAEQLALYYAIGGYVSSNTRQGKWGTGAIEAISEQLQKELPGLRGFSATNLKNMRLFFEAWEPCFGNGANSSVATDELAGQADAIKIRQLRLTDWSEASIDDFASIGFTHHSLIISRAKQQDERLFYIRKCAREHMSAEALRRSIKADDYHHQGALPNNFLQTLPAGQQALRAIAAFKDEYLLDFINVEELGARDAEDVDERVLEQGIVQNVKNFIMTFGRDFTFVGNQYHLDAFGQDQYIDLLFFNRELNCLVAVELKAGPFKTAYLGQLSGYLSILDGFVKKGHENPSIGLVLCKDMDRAFVDYVVRDYAKPMGVATYKTSKDMSEELLRALPPIEDLEALLERGE
ncbi:PDDEXK nuclease domain-containing protein [Olsenella uli]|uniref:PDDEXK nuclease domain-containing protein n=1 Tax=Olsenella uli TaxID=133926 RepID=UPI0024A8B06E|nr:PDDEXK nuclease domain-containing protein [Olsenella uli]